jgi:hypothetical protein
MELENFSSSPPCLFYTPKNPILPLITNSVRKNRNFSSSNSGKFCQKNSVLPFKNNSVFPLKKFRFIETEFFMKGKTENSGGKKETWGLKEKRSWN